MTALQAPIPYFGGKSRVAQEVWARLGDVPNYVEPFFGSGAMLLGRPSWHLRSIETVNDKDGMVANFWRAIAAAPEEVARWADWPVNENDLHARHIWLVGQRDSLTERLEGDPDYYDAKIAGWWCWGMSGWIGGGFCSGQGPWQSVDGKLVRSGDAGKGVWRPLPHLGSAGRGVNRKRVHLGNAGRGVSRAGIDIYAWFAALAERLRRVRVCSGDWTRICGTIPTFLQGVTGVFLDPPYAQSERDPEIYSVETDVSQAVREWAIGAGKNSLMRVAICGYADEHDMPANWQVYEWKAQGGYANLGNGAARENAKRERIWFSPHCLPPQQPRLLLEVD